MQNRVSLQQLTFTGVVVASLNILLLHHYFKDYTPLPLSCPTWNTFQPKRSSFPDAAPASTPVCCSIPKLSLQFHAFGRDAHHTSQPVLLYFFSRSLCWCPAAQKPQCLGADSVPALGTDSPPRARTTAECHQQRTDTDRALTLTSQGPRRVDIPGRSQPLEQCNRPAKDSQVKPDAAAWKDTGWELHWLAE